MKAKLLSLLIFGVAVFFDGYAEKNALASTSWKLAKVQCTAVAVDAANQAYVDSSLAYLQSVPNSPANAFECEFQETELVVKSKSNGGKWKYKQSANKLIVDFGNGNLCIWDVKSISDKELVFGMDKKRFFISDYAKDETLKGLVQTLDLELKFQKKE
ncbi:MAG: hypothetical protein MJZ28_06670 [Paludibacteraceae bacterium]|nr:hypothetical protein [Paludibacteraceae bacterium]